MLYTSKECMHLLLYIAPLPLVGRCAPLPQLNPLLCAMLLRLQSIGTCANRGWQ